MLFHLSPSSALKSAEIPFSLPLVGLEPAMQEGQDMVVGQKHASHEVGEWWILGNCEWDRLNWSFVKQNIKPE